MKWLATTFLSLLTITASAETIQSQEINPIILPLVTLCSPLEPDLGLLEKYGEIGFIEGDASIYVPGGDVINGKLKFYMNPDFDTSTFTIMFQAGELYCMIMSGKEVQPMAPSGDPL
jgi:hypothetical protein